MRECDSRLAAGRPAHNGSTDQGQEEYAALQDKLSRLNTSKSDCATLLLLKSTGCAQSSSSSCESLDWLLIVLGRTRTRTIVSWLVACVIHKGYEWQDTDVCVSAGSWSNCTAARVLDTLCQLRGDAVKRTMLAALAMLRHREITTHGADLNGKVNGHAALNSCVRDSAVPVACLMGGIVRVCTQCPCVFKEIASTSELDHIISPRFVSEVASHMSSQQDTRSDQSTSAVRIPADACKKLASLILQRAGLISMRDLCRVMALLTPSGLVACADGDAHRRTHKKRKTGLGAAAAGDLELLVSAFVRVIVACVYRYLCFIRVCSAVCGKVASSRCGCVVACVYLCVYECVYVVL